MLWPITDTWLAILIALGSTMPIALRRTRPLLAAFLATLVWLIPTDGYVAVGYIAVFVLFYSAGAYAASLPRVLVLAAYTIALGLWSAWRADLGAGEYIGSVTAVVLPTLAGRLVRHHREQAEQLRALTAELERERERTAQLAVAEERARIARELHDVVAHGLSVIAIQADGAEAALQQDPELAQRPLRTIRRSAEEALAEMRRLLGVLRTDEQAQLAPQPGLAQLPTLVERARSAGLPVTLHVDGRPRALPASLDLSAYRIVQEALTNVHKHAGDAPTSVKVVWRRNLLGIQVRDTGTPGVTPRVNGSGHGLVGMRERVRLHGGELRTEAHPHGGFEVVAKLPL